MDDKGGRFWGAAVGRRAGWGSPEKESGYWCTNMTPQEVLHTVVNSSGSDLVATGVYSRQKPEAALQPRYPAADLWGPWDRIRGRGCRPGLDSPGLGLLQVVRSDG